MECHIPVQSTGNLLININYQKVFTLEISSIGSMAPCGKFGAEATS
jgi:hypothetical protein